MREQVRAEKNQMVFYSIKASSIKNFLVIDLFVGTGIYYIVKIIASSMVIGMISSMLGTEGIKKIPKLRKVK